MGNQHSRKSRDTEGGDDFETKLPDNVNWNKTVPFVVPLKKGKVIKVYDGDTITVAAKLPQFNPNTIYRFSIRLRGIDAPELKSENEEEKEMAIKARDTLHNFLYNKYVTLDNISSEKYSRILADVYCNGICMSDWMINKRYAVPYDGRTKKSPSSWKRFFETGDMGDVIIEESNEDEDTQPGGFVTVDLLNIPVEIKGENMENLVRNLVGNIKSEVQKMDEVIVNVVESNMEDGNVSIDTASIIDTIVGTSSIIYPLELVDASVDSNIVD